MFGLENKAQKKSFEQELEELEIKMKAMERESAKHLTELGISSAEVKSYIENRENFTDEMWKLIQGNLKAMDEKLSADLNREQSPEETKKRYENRNPAPHWLPIP